MDGDRVKGRVVETAAASVVSAYDGIVEIRWKDGVIVGLAEIEDVLDAQARVMGERVAVLVDARPVRTMTRAAQSRSANHPINDSTVAVGILVDGPVSVVLGNFFIRLTRPSYSTKLFRHEEPARAWLRARLETPHP